MKNHNECKMVGERPAAQKAALESIPQTVANHKNPDFHPVGTKAQTGYRSGESGNSGNHSKKMGY